MIAGSKKVLPEHEILFRFIKDLKKFCEDEFLDLNDKEQSYLDYSVSFFKNIISPVNIKIRNPAKQSVWSLISVEGGWIRKS